MYVKVQYGHTVVVEEVKESKLGDVVEVHSLHSCLTSVCTHTGPVLYPCFTVTLTPTVITSSLLSVAGILFITRLGSYSLFLLYPDWPLP